MKDLQRNWNVFWNRSPAVKASWSKQRIQRVIDPYLDPGKSILDAGCGSGFFSAYFCDKGLNATAVDYADSALSLTQEMTSNRARIVKADMFSESFRQEHAGMFDIVFSDGLLEHFEESGQNKLLSNFAGILKSQGLLITFVPNLFSLWTLIRPLLMPGIEEKPFTIKRLIALNRRNGFNVTSYGGVNVLPWKHSPEKFIPHRTGMLIFTVAEKNPPGIPA